VWEFFSSAWALAIVPSAIAIAGVVAFAKTLLENRNLQLEKQRLQLEISAATRRVIIPSESQIEKYGVVRVAMQRTVRLSGIVLAVLLPVSVALQTGPMPSVPQPDEPGAEAIPATPAIPADPPDIPLEDRPANELPARPDLPRPAPQDLEVMLRDFRTMGVNATAARFFANDQMKAALHGNKDFAALQIMIVDDPGVADVILDVGYTFAWDYPFSLTHRRRSIVLVSGKGVGRFSGPAGAESVTRELVALLKPYRPSARN
jgi:hypothetical protein